MYPFEAETHKSKVMSKSKVKSKVIKNSSGSVGNIISIT
uniref:Uncharacterized protein n=1 Tax=Rhizophora mucronata TaxID=61149 RepID=A0A2P2MRD0_RHIMU